MPWSSGPKKLARGSPLCWPECRFIFSGAGRRNVLQFKAESDHQFRVEYFPSSSKGAILDSMNLTDKRLATMTLILTPKVVEEFGSIFGRGDYSATALNIYKESL